MMQELDQRLVPTPPPRKRVALIVETSVVYGRQILSGIARYLRANRGWSVYLEERELGTPPPEWLSQWDGDGVICRSTTPEWAEIFRQRGLPVVDLNDQHLDLGLPRVASDMKALGRLGARHLRKRGFKHLAYCGFFGETWSAQRREGFMEGAEMALPEAHVYESRWKQLRKRPYEEELQYIALWLRSLPRPVGIMACNDVRARHVLDACRFLGLLVPDEVAVVGVDNAETFCELCDPPLSSVLPDAGRIGEEAAALLDRLMAGEAPPPHPLLIPPLGVVSRRSTDAWAVNDPLVARAVHFIREHACEGIRVWDVVKHLNCSRAWLERSFREYLGHSPNDQIRKLQLQRARELLLSTDWTLPHIAAAVGFKHSVYMSNLFSKAYGCTPARYRRIHKRQFPEPVVEIRTRTAEQAGSQD